MAGGCLTVRVGSVVGRCCPAQPGRQQRGMQGQDGVTTHCCWGSWMVEDAKKSAPDSDIGRLVLHRFCGDEEFVLCAAEMLAYRDGDGVRLWFDAASSGECLRSQPDTVEAHPEPSVSVRVDLPALTPNELVGRRFVPTDRDAIADLPAAIFYFDTYELLEPVVEIIRRDGQVFEVRITGVSTDVNHYDGSKPPTRVELVGWFKFAKVSEWEPAR
jgi:hypothetical protein